MRKEFSRSISSLCPNAKKKNPIQDTLGQR